MEDCTEDVEVKGRGRKEGKWEHVSRKKKKSVGRVLIMQGKAKEKNETKEDRKGEWEAALNEATRKRA